MPRRVRLAAWLAFALHGILILTARYRLSYDAYNHMFFGDHYRLDWWSLWEPRWYTGFEVTSYPPLTHQLIGLFGHLIGVDAAFGLLLWAVLSAYPLAVYAFCRVFTGKAAAWYAALGAAVLPSIYQTAHTFGQLPTLTSTLFALFAMAALNDYLLKGNRLSAACSVALIAALMAAHHATLMFLPWAVGAVFIHSLLNTKIKRLILLRRLGLFGFLAALVGLLVIWPFWLWGLGQSMQTPIDHASRHNFFTDPFAPMAFFLPTYGAMIPLIPFVLWKGFRRKTLGLWAAFVILFVLGLGGTTPLPRLMFGSNWEWLTYDRFAFWASLLLLPFLGIGLVSVRKKLRLRWPQHFQIWSRLFDLLQPRRWLLGFVFSVLGLTALIAGLLPTLLPTQPTQIDMQPIVDFLAAGDRSQWRYLTFGLGDQLAYLSRLTKATSIDGSYHTARSLPELRVSGLGQIDTAFWLVDGFSRLDPVLQKSGQRGVRWGFVNRSDYIPILERNGWVEIGTLTAANPGQGKTGLQVWENPRAILPPAVKPPVESPLASFSWGVFPISALLIALSLGALRLWPLAAQQALLKIHFILVGLLPLGLCFWYFRTLFVFEHLKVYFTYEDALFFLSDALALAAFLCWALARAFGPSAPARKTFDLSLARASLFSSPAPWLFGICLLATLSSLWSLDWRVSLYFSLHLWLAFGLFLSVRARPEVWRAFALGSAAALFLQAALGFGQFVTQNTAFLSVLGLNWPGNLRPGDQAASVVQLVDGTRWLRVYGSLPHPNILAGLVFVFLAGLVAFYLLNRQYHPIILFLIGCGSVVLVLTFSRSAWLALGAFALILAAHYRSFERRRLLMLAVLMLVSLGLVCVPLRALIFTRAGATPSVSTEDFSSKARLWLLQESLQFIRERPLGGYGAGTFILELAQRASYGYIVEPVHNLGLLITTELGLPGGLLFLGLAVSICLAALQARRPEQIIFAALVLGLGVIAIFDHYLWTLAPGRVLLALALGLLAAQQPAG
jgi:O-antigen ligase